MRAIKQFFLVGLLGLAVVLLVAAVLLAHNGHRANAQEGSPLHPTFTLLDKNGANVLESGLPVSTMKTCGTCHDTTFIAEHSFHADAGLTQTGNTKDHSWDTSTGLFGGWDPITYRYLSSNGDERVDLTTAEWIQIFGPRHVGGGPAVYGTDGQPLTSPSDSAQLQNQIVDPETGDLIPWDWQLSGDVEMNCFLCHFTKPNNQARITMLQEGKFQWANTATLLGSGIVNQQENGQWQWNLDAFDTNGQLKEEFVTLQDPSNENCGLCHGLTHTDIRTPLVFEGFELEKRITTTTGQVFSPQFLSESGLDLKDKDTLTRPWDVHAARVVECTNCHYSINNPVYFQETDEKKPENIDFDPRRIDVGDYLYRPVHDFAKGQSDIAPDLNNTMRRCDSCHDEQSTHDWLPYLDRHMSVLACETCHIPDLYGPARQTNDWTVLTLNRSAEITYRGVESELFTGYKPVVLPRTNGDDTVSLAPYNLITSWYWVYGNPEQPVPLRDLQAVWLDSDHYAADILTIFDQNGDDTLDNSELFIDSQEKETLIASRLEARGLENPHIQGEVRPYSINHDVVNGDWAIKDCEVCHTDNSRLSQRMLLADRVPYNVMPTFVSDSSVLPSGEIAVQNGKLYYEPKHNIKKVDLYVFGHDSADWIDAVGALLFLGTVLAISAHSGLRYFVARRRIPEVVETRRVYMYSVYERQWHWLQTIAILLLIFTGLIIHKPEFFGIFSFRYIVQIHNILAAILVINAALAAFYHFASGDIRQFLPRPHGFFDQMFAQARYYLIGIFRDEPHPLEKTRNQKMNPLQQITYLAILNILLPMQVLTGILMWGAQTWPDTAEKLGGLGLLAPLHTLIAWLFATFIVGHIYMTTTEYTPLTGIKSMVTGWSELEAKEN